jgi:hypothetical protein
MHTKKSKRISNKKEQTTNLKTSDSPKFKKSNSKVILATTCLLTIVILGAVTGGFGSFKSIVRADTVKGVGVGIYWDQSFTNRTSALNWGQIAAGSSKTLTIYVKNEDNFKVSLKLDTSNWTPVAAENYISLGWNYSGQVLSVNEALPIELTLTIKSTADGVYNFDFNTIITTVEH